MAIAKVGDGLFFPGIDRIDHDFHAEPILPAHLDLSPAQISPRARLDALYALDDLHASILKSLEPPISDPGVLLPAEFFHELFKMPRVLKEASQKRPRVARPCGLAAHMLAEELARRGLAWQLRAALCQA
jgi:hypothetical protein